MGSFHRIEYGTDGCLAFLTHVIGYL